MNVKVRALTPADLQPYRDIRLESLRLHPECFGANYEAQRQLAQMHFEQKIASQDPHHTMLGAFDGELLMGLCGVSALENHVALITQMYVKSAYQGHGVGQILIDAAKRIAVAAHQAHVLQLNVYPHNLRAKRRYEQAGFQVAGQTERELNMVLTLR
ncbi:GNAT family N-acetyltransferase [Photobacterium sp. 1_MG-2023]|uniref:GNAT family N-acetyltransferase n=1 Tax=Photobacterium sp. 1_MG-2023 TaxID=3062646 RepID=UPI0026E180B4|nr:GNAT family N-acetyltransferase [Photobacterium sp. 1_MG-2023]MDO6708616.1 GNAT family N-acetyltransferase [Photobacterium sp. 1_MG-2023]